MLKRMKNWKFVSLIIAFLISISGCAIPPAGPTVQVIPGTNKTWAQFTNDGYQCQQIATAMVGNPAEMAQEQIVGGIIVGTILGGLTGGLIGSTTGSGRGTSTGVGLGAVAGGTTGGLIGSQRAEAVGATVQMRWDQAYSSCMYNFGHKIPGYQEQPAQPSQPAPQPAPPPPPPPPPPRQ